MTVQGQGLRNPDSQVLHTWKHLILCSHSAAHTIPGQHDCPVLRGVIKIKLPISCGNNASCILRDHLISSHPSLLIPDHLNLILREHWKVDKMKYGTRRVLPPA